MNVIFKGNRPTRATEESAGYDLHSVENQTIYPSEMKVIRTGLTTAMPAGMFAALVIRSGCAKRGLKLANSFAVIDADFRGEWMLMVENHGADPYRISEGDRLAQAVFLPYFTPNFIPGNPAETARGEGGFGSTGV